MEVVICVDCCETSGIQSLFVKMLQTKNTNFNFFKTTAVMSNKVTADGVQGK